MTSDRFGAGQVGVGRPWGRILFMKPYSGQMSPFRPCEGALCTSDSVKPHDFKGS